MDASKIRRALLAVFSGVLAACSAPPALAQAWLPPKGEAWFSLGYGNIFSRDHYTGVVNYSGVEDVGHIRSQSIGMALGYAVTNRLMLDVSLPFVISKYYGPTAHPGSSADDGNYHGILQDYRFNIAYQILSGGVALAPFFTAVIPSHDYVYFAHAAAGKDLHQYLLGFSLGGRLDRLLPGSYAEVTYNYAFVEHVLGINVNRSDFAFEAGYYLVPSLSARFLGVGYYTHGGLAFHTPPDLFNLPNGSVLFVHHDQIGKSRRVDVGGGLTYVLTGSTELYASYLRSVYGRDGHKVNNGLSFGVTWNFSPAQLVRRAFPPKGGRVPAGTP